MAKGHARPALHNDVTGERGESVPRDHDLPDVRQIPYYGLWLESR
jgi:hypothetical protein